MTIWFEKTGSLRDKIMDWGGGGHLLIWVVGRFGQLMKDWSSGYSTVYKAVLSVKLRKIGEYSE